MICVGPEARQKTFSRYWDFSIPSAEVRPTNISKVFRLHSSRFLRLNCGQVNTALQLLLMGFTTISPLIPFQFDLSLHYLQWLVAATTISSGLSYVFSKDAVRILAEKRHKAKN